MATRVRSIRLDDALWSKLQADADAIGVSLNAYVADRLAGPAAPTPRPAAKSPVRAGKPVRGFDAATGEPIYG